MATFNVVCITLVVGVLLIFGANAIPISTLYLQKYCDYKPDGLYPYSYGCSQFVQCVNHKTYVSSCGGLPYTILYFNDIKQACDWPQNLSPAQIEACSQPSGITVVEQAVTGKAIVSCPSGYSLLSCSFANTQTTNRDPFRQSVPINSTSCACSDIYGFLCIARCAAVQLQDFEIMSIPLIRRYGYTYVSCPSGKQVLGCHIAFDDGYAPGYVSVGNVGVLPAPNGGCWCYQQNGGNCVATCASASSFLDYEVPSLSGYDTVTRLCSPGSFVIGVGYISVDPMNNQSFPYARVLSDSFQASYCYNPDHSIYCLAICGKFTSP